MSAINACSPRPPSPESEIRDTAYDYARTESFDAIEINARRHEGVVVADLSYASPIGGRVPAYLVLPGGEGPFPLVVFAHWMMDASPLRNRSEFLDEALVLARTGAMALLPDAPQVRPQFVPAAEPIDAMRQSAEASRQLVIDVRRGIDLLIARRRVDTNWIAFVGHSFGAHVGGISRPWTNVSAC